jgi:DNA-binding LacI/PurR family transcriptional regulator
MTAMQPARTPTLLDVARAAGVSRTTASNAFNRPDQLSKALRRKVLAEAAKLGYAGPNPVARVLRTGKTNTIGLISPDPLGYLFTDPAAIALLRGIASACEPQHTGLLILPADAPDAVAARVGEAVVDGFLLYCGERSSPVLDALAQRGLPSVAIDLDEFALGPSVTVDDHGGAAAAARHVVGLGHSEIAILSLDFNSERHRGPVGAERRVASRYKPTRDRLSGYLDALTEAGLDPDRVPVLEEPENDPAAAEKVALDLLRRRPRPTAILAMSDLLAIGIMRAAQRLGLDVPRDLSVVGFDDVPLAQDLAPPLTTIRQPLTEKGRIAAGVLLGTVAAPPGPLPTELVVRSSAGPAPPGPPVIAASGDTSPRPPPP